MTRIDNAAIAQQLGLSREEMIARFGEPGSKTPEEIGSALGMDHDAIIAAFGEKNSTDSGDSFVSSTPNNDTDASDELTTTAADDADDTNGTNNAEQTRDDKIKAVAEELNLDKSDVAKVMRRLEDGSYAGLKPEEVVSKLVSATGLSEYVVGQIIDHIK